MPMTETRIETLAESILEAHLVDSLPVDPLDLAQKEGIRSLPGDYDGCFDARIEHRLRHGTTQFYLFYAHEAQERSRERVRFSLAHELGHYYLPEHRRYLLTGEWLGKPRPFLRARRVEREANWFAAALLMPREQFIEQVQRHGAGGCTLAQLEYLAGTVFHTSLLSTALRYVQLNFQPCCVIVSENGQYRYCIASDSLRNLGYWCGAHIPSQSVTAQSWADLTAFAQGHLSGLVPDDVWFSTDLGHTMLEEVAILAGTGMRLTFLMLPEE